MKVTATKIGPVVTMLTAPNPGPKTLGGTNAYVVGLSQRVIIDPGPDMPDYTEAVAGWIVDSGGIEGIVLTHGHPDHADGAPGLASILDVPILAHAETVRLARGQLSVDVPLEPGDVISLGDLALRVVPAPGHSYDHICLLLEPDRLLFSGDTILGLGTTLIAQPEGDMVAYMETLHSLKGLQPAMIAPGHGPLITDSAAKIDEYVHHRHEREEALLGVLRSGAANANDLVSRVYGDVAPEIRRLAVLSVGAQLAKLEAEGRVVKTGERYGLARV